MMKTELLELPRQLILTVTSRCNHRCEMCYYHESLNQESLELSVDEYERLSKNLNEIDELFISGGEPFLRKDLVEIVHLFYLNNQTRNVFIPTNGSRPPEINSAITLMLDRMPDLHLAVMFSLEGLQPTHDRMHGKEGAFSSTQQCIEDLGFLRIARLNENKISFRMNLNSVVTNRNISEIIPLMEHIKRTVWVDSHTFSPMRGSGPDENCKPPDADRFAELACLARPYFDSYFPKKTTAEELRNRYDLWTEIMRGNKLPYQCQAGNLIGVIEPDGRVRLCELTDAVGALRDVDFDFKKLWHSEEANEMRHALLNCSCTHACFLSASEKYHANLPSPKAVNPG